MSQFYSDLTREDDTYALPDSEVFYVSLEDVTPDSVFWPYGSGIRAEQADKQAQVGWYYWACSPGCLPDSDPTGPFATEAEALADARDFV